MCWVKRFFLKSNLTQILLQRLIKTFITSKYEVDGQEASNIFIMTHLFTFSSLFILVSNAGIGKGCWKPLFAIFPFFSKRYCWLTLTQKVNIDFPKRHQIPKSWNIDLSTCCSEIGICSTLQFLSGKQTFSHFLFKN